MKNSFPKKVVKLFETKIAKNQFLKRSELAKAFEFKDQKYHQSRSEHG